MPGYEKETMEWKASKGGKRAEKRNKKKWDVQGQWRGEDVWTGWKEKKEVELTFLQGSWEWRPAW